MYCALEYFSLICSVSQGIHEWIIVESISIVIYNGISFLRNRAIQTLNIDNMGYKDFLLIQTTVHINDLIGSFQLNTRVVCKSGLISVLQIQIST